MGDDEKTIESESIHDIVNKAYDEAVDIAADERLDESLSDVQDTPAPSEDSTPAPDDESESDGGDTSSDTEGADQAQEKTKLQPPMSWSGAAKERFYELPEDIQEVVVRREQQLANFMSERQSDYDKLKNELSGFQSVTKDLDEKLKASGISSTDYLSRLVAADQMLARDPISGLKRIISSMGISVDDLSSEDSESGEILALRSEIESLKAQIENNNKQKSNTSENGNDRILEDVQREIHTFRSEVGSDGRLKHPYFDDVRDDMSLIVSRLERENPNASHRELLEKAYQKALQINDIPKTQQSVSGGQNTQNAKTKVKKLSRSVTGAPNGVVVEGDPLKEDLSVRDVLMKAYDELALQ